MLDVVFTYGGLKPLGFAPVQPFGAYPWQPYVQLGDGHWPTPGMHQVAAPSTALSRGSLLLLSQLSINSNYMVGHTALGLGRVTQSLYLPYMMGRESSVPGLVPSDDTVDSESAVDSKAGDFGMMIWYQVDELINTWSAEWFVAHSHIYPGFRSKVSSVTYFPLELGCED